jgi:hypothetical protein
MKQTCKVIINGIKCKKIHRCKGYCSKHYRQIIQYNHILKRTKFDQNEIILDYKKHIAYIILYNIKHQEIAKAIIDLEDIDNIKGYKWCLTNENRVYNSKNKIFLHNLIMNSKGIDHINGNPLDNKKSNLRLATPSQNNMNNNLSKANTTGYKGIEYIKKLKKWKVKIDINKKRIFLGYFKKIKDAIKVRKNAEIKYFEEYRRK